MKDQPFKRSLQTDKSNPQENYKYPTYQHYYQHKGSKGNQQSSPKKVQVNTDKNIPSAVEQSPRTPLVNKKSTKSSLKAQLQNLKIEVQRIMERKQGILKSPIDKKLFTNIERNKSESQLAMSPSKVKEQAKEEGEDNQSVSSQTLLVEPLKKLDLKAATENYDHAQYMQLQNDLLKTELKNLKNKYVNKKQELNEKCEALQKKVIFLETSLANSEQSLAAEIAILKENLKEVEKEKNKELIPTSDKAKDHSPVKQTPSESESEVVKEKIKKLYDELAKKSKTISQNQQKLQDFTNEISKLNKDLSFKDDKIKSLTQQIQELKTTNSTNLNLIAEKDTRIQQILDELQQQRSKQYENHQVEMADQSENVNLLEEKFELLKSEYENKIELLQKEFKAVIEEKKNIIEQKLLLEEELKFEQNEKQLRDKKIENLNEKIKEALENNQNIEEKYMKVIEKSEKTHQQSLATLHQDYQVKIMNLSSRRERSLRDQSVSEKSSKSKPNKNNEGTPAKEHQVRKWKLQYKQLKQKYELHIKGEATKRHELKEYYKNYRQYKQKVEIYSQKVKLFQKQLEKNLSLLTAKQKDLLSKQIEIRRLNSDWKLEKSNYVEELLTFKENYKTMEAKYNEQVQKAENEMNYRKDIQEKVFSSDVTDEALKEVLDRMKKRLVQQDEKYSKQVKEIKNKELLNARLKQELKEVMESMEKKINEQTTKEITDLSENYLQKEFDSFQSWKSRVEAEQKLLSESNDSLVNQIQELKGNIYQKDEALTDLQTELNNFAHSYNLKNIQMNQVLDQRNLIIRNYEDQLQQLNAIKNSVENILHEQLSRKSEEITTLRMQIASFTMKPLEYKTFHSNFDDILKGHIQDNKKLREDITKKTEQIFKLRDNYGSLRSQFENMKSEIQINKLKFISQMKNTEINYQVQADKIKNELNMAQKKVNLLEQKFKLLIEENKKKDTFIQTYIVGKKLSQSDKDLVKDFIKKYEITVGSNDLAQRLSNQTQEIEKLNNYNRILLKEISDLKEKVAQFEAIDEEKVSVFDSKFSKYSINSESDINEEQETEAFDIKQRSESKLKKAESMQVFTQIQHEI